MRVSGEQTGGECAGSLRGWSETFTSMWLGGKGGYRKCEILEEVGIEILAGDLRMDLS